MNNYYLTGMMGSGKTTIASALINKNKFKDYKVVDIDTIIVEETKMTINDIFAKYGEKYFRNLETQTLKKISTQDNLIVSCGGGIILSDENISIMQDTGFIIYINRTIKNIISTINTSTRPLLNDGIKKVHEIFKKRKKRYFSTADYKINNNGNIDNAIEQLLKISQFPIVGFQGTLGSYSNIATIKYFSKKKYKFVYFPTFDKLLEEYVNKRLDYVVIPIYNSTTGNIEQTINLLNKINNKSELTKITIPIHHNLLTLQNTEKINEVWSHPQALRQCCEFINKNNYLPIEKLNTAIACKELLETQQNNVGVVASSLAAKKYHLKIIKKNIENNKKNKTTFLVLSK